MAQAQVQIQVNSGTHSVPTLLPPKPSALKAVAEPSQLARLIPVDLIDPNPHQPRHALQDDDVRELAASIAARGILQPLLVCPHQDRYHLIAGYRRLTASKFAGLVEVPCAVRSGSSNELLEYAILENIQRQDLTYIEEAESYRRLMEMTGIDQQTVAKRLNKSEGLVSKRLALLELPPDVQQAVSEGRLSIKAALEVGRIRDAKRRAKLALRADRLSFEELQKLIGKILDKQKAGRKPYEHRAPRPTFKHIFEGLPVQRVYKDRVTFVFKSEFEFIDALKAVIKRYEFENQVEG